MTPRKSTSSKRTNRTQGVGELINKLIDPVLKKRGFASRDLLENWAIIAPPPYDEMSVPDRLKWPRGQAGGDGAILFLRCHEGHRLGLAHDHERVTGAVNRYFGYHLVQAVKLSGEPFTARSDKNPHVTPKPTPKVTRQVDAAISGVEDDELKLALEKLGHGIFKKEE